MKTKHKQQIKDFFLNDNKEVFQQRKLIALYRLIQIKGKTIKAEENRKGFKAIKVDKNYYGMEVKSFKKGNFFPCVLHSFIVFT